MNLYDKSFPKITLAIDTMGADLGPSITITGASLIASKLNVKFIFVGNEKELLPLIKMKSNLSNSSVVHTADYVKANEKGAEALRTGKNTSMRLGIELVKSGKADALVSAGNTGALLSMAYVVLRPISGISRPAMIAYFPTKRGEKAMLDLGANIDCDSRNLVDFAIMGSAFCRIIFKLKNPSVGLLNVGEEAQKGNNLLQETANLLNKENKNINYYGFVEGDDISEGKVDVIVTDGFSGNIALKTAEGTAKLVIYFLRKSFQSSILSKIGYFLAHRSLKKMKSLVDPRSYNGAVMVGLNGIVVKSHGSADGKGFSNAINVAYEMVQGNFIADLKNNIDN